MVIKRGTIASVETKYYTCVRCKETHLEGTICPGLFTNPQAHDYDCACHHCDAQHLRDIERLRAVRTKKVIDARPRVDTLPITQCEGCGWDTIFGPRCHWCQELADLRAAKQRKPRFSLTSVERVYVRVTLALVCLLVGVGVALGEWADFGMWAMAASLLLGYAAFFVGIVAAAVRKDQKGK